MCDMDGGFDGGYDVDYGEDMDNSTDMDDVTESDAISEVDSITELGESTFDSLEDIDNRISETTDLGELYDMRDELTNMHETLEESNNPEFSNLADMESSEFDEVDDEGDESGAKSLGEYPNMREIWESSTEGILDNYRENLENRGVPEEKIDEFLTQEREAMEREYESARAGETSENIYYMPENWDEVAEEITNIDEGPKAEYNEFAELENVGENDENISENIENDTEEIAEEEEAVNLDTDLEAEGEENYEETDIVEEMQESTEQAQELAEEFRETEVNDELEENEEVEDELIESEETDDIEDTLEDNEEDITDVEQDVNEQINYDEIYQEIDQEALEQGFENIDIAEDAEQLDSVLENFEADAWENLSLDEQKESMSNLAEYVSDTIGFENPPQIEYYNNSEYGDYGSYNPYTNTLSVNEYMLENSEEAADTIAHELWHAHQHECAENPQSSRDYQYRYNFENYISPEYGQTEYENQLVEAEARAFANQFKDRLAGLGGRKR